MWPYFGLEHGYPWPPDQNSPMLLKNIGADVLFQVLVIT